METGNSKLETTSDSMRKILESNRARRRRLVGLSFAKKAQAPGKAARPQPYYRRQPTPKATKLPGLMPASLLANLMIGSAAH